MPIAVTEEHEDLRRTAQRWLETHCPPPEPRAAAEAPSTPSSLPPSDGLPAVWEKMAAQGWLGPDVPEHLGGQGFDAGRGGSRPRGTRACARPRPARRPFWSRPPWSGTAPAWRRESSPTSYPPWPTAPSPLLVALGASPLECTVSADGSLVLRGTARPVLGLPAAGLVLFVPVARHDAAPELRLLDRDIVGDRPMVSVLLVLDATRPVGLLECPSGGLVVPKEHGVRVPDAEVRGLAFGCRGRERRARPLVPLDPRPSTPRCGWYSDGPSASFRPSSTRWLTCSSRSSSALPSCGMRGVGLE